LSEGPAFYIYRDRAGEYRWRLLAANNEIVADSAEGYSSKQGCITAAQRVEQLVNDARLHLHDDT
jgi:hypothetical protein